ncbi:MAG: TetR/AcrR family transcriptional regulator [Nitrospinae bacterium]|nr:TetR/AcrR family transcriptional regulator [Nitrospinota bacterium]
MDSKNPDRRVQKTLGLLSHALIALIKERSYESIKVQDILDRANVGRSTFYSHFKDKDDLLIKGFDNLRRLLNSAHNSGNDYPGSALISFSGAMFSHAYDHRQIYQATAGGQTGLLIMGQMEKIIFETIAERLKTEKKRRGKFAIEIPDELFCHHLASAFTSVIKWWLDRRTPVSATRMDEYFQALAKPLLERSFGKN